MYKFRDRFPRPDDNQAQAQIIRSATEAVAMERIVDLMKRTRAEFATIMSETMDTLPTDTSTTVDKQLEDCFLYLNDAADSVGALELEDVKIKEVQS